MPIAPLTVAAEVVRPGHSVEMVEATLSDEQGPIWRSAQTLLVDRRRAG